MSGIPASETIIVAIERVLEEHIRPTLHMHGGDVAISSVDGDILKLHMLGQCSGCPSAQATLENLLKEEILKFTPSIRDVVLTSETDQRLVDIARAILHGERP